MYENLGAFGLGCKGWIKKSHAWTELEIYDIHVGVLSRCPEKMLTSVLIA